MSGSKFVEIHTEQMQHYKKASAGELGALYQEAQKQSQNAGNILMAAKEHYFYALIRDIVAEHYDIGELMEIYQIFGGYINTTFGIYTRKDGERQTWLFRMYKRNKDENSLQFEHNLLRHAKQNGFTYGAAPIDTREGTTYCKHSVKIDGGEEDFVFAIFNYVDGDVLYDWIPNWAEPGLAEVTIQTGASCLAQFHSSTVDFDPKGLHGDNIMDNEDSPGNILSYTYPERMKLYSEKYNEAGLDSPYTEFFESTYDLYHRMCKKNFIPPEDFAKLQYNPCHCDGHAGNFKYAPDGTILGSFDYDMAKFDARLFDLGVAIHYLFASWKFRTNGVMRLDRVERYLKYYNEEICRFGKIPPLSDLEKRYLYEAIVQGTAYCTGWCTTAVVLDPTLNQCEYLYYAQHYAACMQWLEDHEAEVRAIADKL